MIGTKFVGEFKEFATRGNIIDLALGVILGTAFNRIVQSLVNDVIMPPIGLLLQGVDFSNLYINISGGEYESLQAARDAGAVTINYGTFINEIIAFIITAFALFIIVKQVNRFRRKEQENPTPSPTTKDCPFCFSSIPLKATRCPNCTSTLT